MTRSRNAAPRLARAVRPAGPFRPGAFGSALHETRVASILSVALGVSFTICFLTGLASHWAQLAQPAIAWPAAPRDLYRWTQGAQVVSPLRLLAVLTPRRSDAGSQGVPVNKDARTAGVVERASDPAFRLQVVGAVARPLTLSLDDLRARASREADLPITCVEGWSVGARWRGVPVRALLAEAGAGAFTSILVSSLQQSGPFRNSRLSRAQALHPDTLLAVELNGEPLELDHGFPVRLIAPNRPGVLQTKWVGSVRAE